MTAGGAQMREVVAMRWATALESGLWRQTRGALRDGHAYCVFGVLCDLSNIQQWQGNAYGRQHGRPPKSVCKWAGLRTYTGRLGSVSLMELSDDGVPFWQLALIIRNRWGEL
jgi:hypothetical protein